MFSVPLIALREVSKNPELYPDLPTCARPVGLKRLGIDTIDLLHLHRVGKNTPIKVTVGAMAELVKCVSLSFSLYSHQVYTEGMKHLGLSEVFTAALSRTLGAPHRCRDAAVEVEYSPFTFDIADSKISRLKTARELRQNRRAPRMRPAHGTISPRDAQRRRARASRDAQQALPPTLAALRRPSKVTIVNSSTPLPCPHGIDTESAGEPIQRIEH
ncbi:hypothetical protein GGX14DRAFT_618967 [Mycena pura]|uniref:NADP-dependent oxidoreductase domain-containing protein n=1 Tax=Mycena pura TaxID=153505 RepID=A0AAD6YHA2_9AGAR|nr:hypothetical protein GGX14DRAFT_618967 [Mycena pura]